MVVVVEVTVSATERGKECVNGLQVLLVSVGLVDIDESLMARSPFVLVAPSADQVH